MCERIPIVERLARWERRGVRIVNRPAGIRNTDRERTIAALRARGVPFPAERARARRADGPRGRSAGFPCWVKRGDVHATQEGDVPSPADAAALAATLCAALAARGIASAVVQEHVPGRPDQVLRRRRAPDDGRGRPSWFQWFYHRDQTLSQPCRSTRRRCAAAAARAAAALGLEVFGGDAIVVAGRQRSS